MADAKIGNDGIAVAQVVSAVPSADTPFANAESPEDEAAHARARTRFPVEVAFFVLATLALAFNLGAHWNFALEVNRIYELSLALNMSQANSTGLVAQYQSLISADPANADKYCDVEYFANEGFGFLQSNLLSLRDAALAFFYIGIFPGFTFFLYKLGNLRYLFKQRSMVLLRKFHPVRSPETEPIDTVQQLNPNARTLARVKVGDITVAGQIKRAERFALRGETSGYVIIQIFHDIPLVMIFFLFIAFVERYKGYDCAQCFFNGQICEVPYYFSLTFSDNYILKVAMGACFLHITWNYVSLCLRWTYYIQILEPPWNFAKQFFAWLLSTLVFVASFVAPIAILFVAFVGPSYYGFEDLSGGIALSGLGGGFWSVGLLTFIWTAGLEVGEGIAEGLFCCNFWEVFYFAIPCCEYCDETFTICEVGGCCCCCCC